MYACRWRASLASTRRAAASTAAGGSISGLPSVKSKTLSAPRSALRRAPSSNMRRIHDAFVRLSVTARETIMAAATILWRPREGAGLMAHARGHPDMTPSKPIPEIYRRLGVRPIIHASGTTTRYGGSILRAEALEAMLEDVLAIAHKRGVPVIVDAASMLPPRENLTKFVRLGADLVSFSGGKGIRGPQSTGILAGRRDLVRAAALNASPNQALGRAAKTSKEEIAGLVTALECFMAEDEKAEMKRYHDVCATVAEALADIPGLRAVVEQDAVNRVIPHAVVYFTPDWVGPSGHAVRVALAQGVPHIYVQQGAHQGGYVDEIAVDPINLQPGDEAIVAARLREELTRVPRAS